MADVEPVIADELGDVRRLVELAEAAATLLEFEAQGKSAMAQEIRKVAERLKGRL